MPLKVFVVTYVFPRHIDSASGSVKLHCATLSIYLRDKHNANRTVRNVHHINQFQRVSSVILNNDSTITSCKQAAATSGHTVSPIRGQRAVGDVVTQIVADTGSGSTVDQVAASTHCVGAGPDGAWAEIGLNESFTNLSRIFHESFSPQ